MKKTLSIFTICFLAINIHAFLLNEILANPPGTTNLFISDWPQWKHDSANTSLSPATIRATPNTLWQHAVPGISDGNAGAVLDSSGNVIFLGTDSGEVVSVGPDGTNWATVVGSGGNWGGVAYGNLNTVYAIPYNNTSPNTSMVTAINADSGDIKWTYPHGSPCDTVPTIGPDGTIYASNEDGAFALYDLGNTYTVKWTKAIGGGGYSGSGAIPVWFNPDTSETFLWVNREGTSASSNNMTVLRDDGTNATVAAELPVGKAWSKGAVVDGLCYLGTFNDWSISNLYCLNTTSVVWQAETGINMFNSPGIGYDGRIYVAGQAGNAAAFTSAGVPLWSTNFASDEIVAAPVSLNTNIVYFVSKTDGIVYCVEDMDTYINVLWTYNAGSAIGGTPAVGNDGTLFIAAADSVFALAPYSINPTPEQWSLCGNNKQRQGWYTNGTPLFSAAVVWSNNTESTALGGVWYSRIRLGSGVTDGERFYVAVNPTPVNNNATLLALDLETGTNLWTGVLGGAGNCANGVPAVSDDMVFIGETTADGSGGNRQVYGVDKTNGQIIWSNRLAFMISGGMMLDNGRLYFETDWNPSGLWCLDALSGAMIWTNTTYSGGEWAANGPSLSPDSSVIYAHGDNGQIVAIDTTSGTTVWSRTFAGSNGNLEPIVDTAGNVYCGFSGMTNDTQPDILVQFSPSGNTNWVYTFAGDVWSHGGYALSPDNEMIYCSHDSSTTNIGLTAVNTANGTKKWDCATGGTGGGCVVGAPGNVIIGVFDIGNGVAAARAILDEGANGTILWTIPLSGTSADTDGRRVTWSWPTIISNGDVIVETSEGVIARITVPEPGILTGILGLLLLVRKIRK